MRYLKLYEEFRTEELEETEVKQDQELSDKTIDDVLNPKFFSEEEKEESEEVFQDERGVYHISNWTTY
jgi:septin family protein